MPSRKILLVASFTPTAQGIYSSKQALEEQGHEVVPWDYRRVGYFGKGGLGPVTGRVARALGDKVEQRVGRKFLEAVERVDPDLIFVIKGELIPHQALAKVTQEWGKRAFTWHPDLPWSCVSPSGSAENVWHGVRYYDIAFCLDSYFEEMYLRSGAQRFEVLPLAAAKGVHEPAKLTPEERDEWASDVAFVGNSRPPGSETHQAFRTVLENGFDLKVWGDTWHPDQYPDIREALVGRGAYGPDLARAYSAAKVALNVTQIQTVHGVNGRVFEAAGIGAPLLTDAVGDLPDYYDVGKEVVAYQDIAEIPALLRELLDDPERRAALGKAAHERTMAEHTYHHRMKRMMEFF